MRLLNWDHTNDDLWRPWTLLADRDQTSGASFTARSLAKSPAVGQPPPPYPRVRGWAVSNSPWLLTAPSGCGFARNSFICTGRCPFSSASVTPCLANGHETRLPLTASSKGREGIGCPVGRSTHPQYGGVGRRARRRLANLQLRPRFSDAKTRQQDDPRATFCSRIGDVCRPGWRIPARILVGRGIRDASGNYVQPDLGHHRTAFG